MANRFRFDLKTFEVSSKTFDLSLSMTSRAFIYDVGLGNITQDDLSSLILSKQLWLLPRGLCRLDVHVRLGECDIRGDERDDFLDFIADTICQSSVSRVCLKAGYPSGDESLIYVRYGRSLV